MGRLYLRTIWRLTQRVGESDDSGTVFARWRDESVGNVRAELDVFDAEERQKIGMVGLDGRVYDLAGQEVGWIKTPRLSIFRAKVYVPTEERWLIGGTKWYGKVRARLWISGEQRKREWRHAGAALLLLLKGVYSKEMSRDVDELISNWDLVYLSSLAFTLIMLLPGFADLILRWRLVPALGGSLSYLFTAFLLWWAVFVLLSLVKRQIAAGRTSHAREIRKRYLDLLNRRTGLTGRGRGPGAKKWGFDVLGILLSLGAAILFLVHSLTLLPVAVAGLVAFFTLWLRASPEPWPVAPKGRNEPLVTRDGDVSSQDAETRTFCWHFDGIGGIDTFNTKIKFLPANVQRAREANPFGLGEGFDQNWAGKTLVELGQEAAEVRRVAAALRKLTLDRQFSEYEEIQNTLSFVRDIPFATDAASLDRLKNAPLGISEYWRFPIETLYDANGDCDCKAVLAAALINLLGFRVMLFLSSDPELVHAAIAVQQSGDISDAAFYRDSQGRSYYICEFTERDFAIRERPSADFAGRFEIIDIEQRP